MNAVRGLEGLQQLAQLVALRPPTGWDVGAYALGLYCLARHAGLI